MQYLISVLDTTEAEAARGTGFADPAEAAAIDVFNEALQSKGHWVFAGGLGAPTNATVIDGRGSKSMITDGPFIESKEYMIGFWVIEAADLDIALSLAKDGSKACNRRVEVRPFLVP